MTARPQSWSAWALLASSLLLCALLILWVSGWQFDREAYTGYQGELFVALNRTLNRWPAPIWSNLTLLGDASLLIPLLSPLLLWRPQAWAAVLAAVPVASILSVTGKHLAAVPRPAAVLDHQLFTIIGETLTAHNSFPSGHSLTIFTGVVAVLVALASRPFGWRYVALLLAGVALALSVALSRVAVGAHWPLDVLGGALCGLIAGLSGAAIAERYRRWWQPPPHSIGRCLLGAALVLASLSLIKRAVEEPLGSVALGVAAWCGLVASLGLLWACLSCRRRDRSDART